MASTIHPSAAFARSLDFKASASDLFHSSRDGICGVPLKALGRIRFGSNKRYFAVSAKIRKGKKHDYPWPRDLDLNVKGGVLQYLYHFKPLKEKPNPVTLDFEKPLLDLPKKIIDMTHAGDAT